MNLGAKAVGNIAGIATSVPELLTVSFSALGGFLGTSLYNIISSNIINVVQYIFSIILNKNGKFLRNKGLQIDLLMVAITILIPFILILWNREIGLGMVPVFFILFVISYFINHNAHKLYLQGEQQEEAIEEKQERKNGAIAIYSILLILTGTALFMVGEGLNRVLENLALHFEVPESALGIALGFITSLPELITFFESQRHHKQNQKEGVIEATNNLLTSNLLNLYVVQAIGIFLYTIVK